MWSFFLPKMVKNTKAARQASTMIIHQISQDHAYLVDFDPSWCIAH